jgi:hypothetical protein
MHIKMIRLVFTYTNETILFDVDNRKIIYRDRKWPAGISFIPKDQGFMRKVLMSRNRLSNQMITWIEDANTGKSLAEYDACKTDEELAEVVKKDARLKGCIWRKSFTGEELAAADEAKQIGQDAGYIDKIPVNIPETKHQDNTSV